MRRLGSFLSILALAVFMAVSCNHRPTDESITTQIKAKMFSEPSLKSASVNVGSNDGIVTLTGQVPDEVARLAARTIASQTDGVKQVIDSTTLPSPAPAAATTPSMPAEPTPIPPKLSEKKKPEPVARHETLTYQGKTYALESSEVQQQGASRGKRSAAVIGGSTVLGALIGGLAGGGKGAAIGAGVGAGGGTAVQAATHGEQVKIPSETRLDFTLHTGVPITFIPPKHVPQSAANNDQNQPQPTAAPTTAPDSTTQN